MPLASFLGELLKSGKVTVFTNNAEALEIKAADKKIDIKALNKKIVKNILATSTAESSKGIYGAATQIKTVRSNLGMLRGVAEELSEAGITVTFSYKDKVVVTLGSEANPKLSKIATGTKAIEINNPRKAVEFII
jgi:hypothetical protein